MAGALTVANLLVNIGADLGDLNKGVAQAETTVDRFVGRVGSASAALGKFFVGASLAGIAAAGAGFTAATTAAMDFEKTLSGVRAVSGATATQMKQLSDLALKLGADTSFSATEAAQGIEELVKAGVSMADVMGGAAKASLDLAAAGGISVADAATIASNAMNQFGIKGSEMAGVADLIAGAANASAIDVGQFKYSLQSVGAVAATVGLSFKDTATAIAVLGQAGITGSDAGTSLKTMLMGLQPQTKEQTKLFRDLGLMTKDGANKFFDAKGKVKDLASVSQILQDALKGQTDQQKLATLETLFGSDAIRAAAVLARGGAEGFRDMAKAMGEVSAADVAETRLDNLSGSLEKLKGSLSTVAITVGQQLTPGLRTLVDWATSTVNYWAPTISMFASRVPAAINQTIGEIKEFGTWLAWSIAKLAGIETADYDNAWDALGGAISYVSGEIEATLLPMLQDTWNWLAPKMQSALTWLADDGWPMVTSAIAAFSSWLQGRGIPSVRELWDWMYGKVGGALTWLRDTAWPRMREAASTAITWLDTKAVATLRALWDWLSPKVGAALTWLTQTGWPTLTAAGVAAWTWMTESLFPALGQWWAWLEQKLRPAYSWLIDYGWPMLQTAGAAVWTWLTETLFPALSEWWTWFQDRLSPIYSWFIDYAWPALQSAGAAFWSWITESLFPVLSEWWTWLSDKLWGSFSWFIDYGWPELLKGAKGYGDYIHAELVGYLDDLNQELAKTDTAESWVTIFENLGKFGHYLLTKIDLAGWFSSVGSGASAANGEIGYMAQAIAWISRTLAAWSKWLPGVDVPDVSDPPAAPRGGGGGGGGGGTGGGIDAPPQRSTGGGGGSGLFPTNPYPGGGGSSGGGGGGSGGSSGGGAGSGSGSGLARRGVAARWGDLIEIVTGSSGVPAPIIAGIMDIESSGNPNAESPMNRKRDGTPIGRAQGLMQVMPFHFGVQVGADGEASSSDKARMQDPMRNVLKGAEILAAEYGSFGTWRQAAAAYFGAIDRETGRITGGTDATGTSGNQYVDRFIAAARSYGWAGALAQGGIVSARPGGILANIGEGRYDEAVIPLPDNWRQNGGGFGGGDVTYLTVNVQVNGNALASKEDIATAVVIGLQHAQRTGRTKVAVI